MNHFYSIILGVIQGLTEFLPVSSSGHLVLAQKFIPGFAEPGVVFEVILHLGTLVAVITYFRKSILEIFFDKKYIGILIIGTLPAVFFGLIFKGALESSFKMGGLFLGVQFLITSILCFLTDIKSGKRKEISRVDAFWIGISQAIAILPAISRSGATIFTGVRRGIDTKEAAKYSFLLSIPSVLGANILEILTHSQSIFPIEGYYFTGLVTSFIVGMISIYLTIRFLYKRMFKVFGVYTLLIGFLALLVK